MNKRSWIVATVTLSAATAAAIAHAQPGGQTGSGTAVPGSGSAQPGSGSAQPDSGSAQPGDAQPARPAAHVTEPTDVYVARSTSSGVAFVVKVGEVLYPGAPNGAWTFVENEAGDAGWIETSLLVAGAAAAIADDQADPYAAPAPALKKRPADPRIDMPEVLTIPTGWLLPAAVLYWRTSIDTGGGVSSDARVGLGDVAEFGVATTDNVRMRANALKGTEPDQIQPYATASFRMGVAENRLFENQPGIVLGFRKSFRRNNEGFKTRIAELTLVASKKLGARAAIHVGGAFWDAEISGKHIDGTAFAETMHGYDDAKRQIRAFGGFEARPFDKSSLLIDLGWAPVFCKDCADFSKAVKGSGAIALRPQLSWGVRYQVAKSVRFESGVRVPDIGDFNLLNAQIFGQVTFTSWAIRHAVDDLK